jgi:hypothetical protein
MGLLTLVSDFFNLPHNGLPMTIQKEPKKVLKTNIPETEKQKGLAVIG